MNPNGLSDQQVKQGYSTVPGNFDPVTGQLKTAITSASLAPQPSPDLSQSFTPQANLSTPVVAEATANQQGFQNDYQRYLDLQNQGQDNTLANMIAGVDLQSLTGRGGAQADAENRLGVNQFNQSIADLSSQRGSKLAAYNQTIAQQRAEQANLEAGAGAKGLTTAMLGGQQAALARVREAENQTAAAEIGLLDAQILGTQGKLEAAQNAANRAVDLMYQDREASVNTKLKQIELYTPLFNANEKKKADALTFALGKEQEKLAEEKANAKGIENMVITASSQNAPRDLVERARKAKTPSEAAMILGQYAGDYYAIEKMKLELNKLRGETTGGGDGGGTGSGVGREVVAGVPVESPAYSWLDQYNAGAMSLEDIYTKIGSSKTAEVTKNNLSKLIAAQGGKRVLKMDDTQIAAVNDQIKNINDLLGTSGYNYKVISGASQGGALGVGGRITGAKGDALAMARNLVTNQTLNSLAEAKAKGITFGALSEAELNTVASAASRIAAKIIRNEAGEVTGFSGSEKGFKDDLLAVKKGLERSIIAKTGSPVNKQVELADKALTGASVDTSNGGYIFK